MSETLEIIRAINENVDKQINNLIRQNGNEFKNLRQSIDNTESKLEQTAIRVEGLDKTIKFLGETFKLETKNQISENLRYAKEYIVKEIDKHKTIDHKKKNGNGFINIRLPLKIAASGGGIAAIAWLVNEFIIKVF